MRTSKQLFQQKMKKPSNWDSLNTKDAIEKAGFLEFLDAGFPYFSPIGQRIKINLEKVLADTCEKKGFNRVHPPSIHKKEIVKRSGKYAQFKDEFIDIAGDFVLISTSEEYFLELARYGLESYTQLPIRLFEIGNAIRFIQRPRGILNLREFNGAVLTTFEENKVGYENSLSLFKQITLNVLEMLQIPFKVSKKNGGIEYFYNPSNPIDGGISLAMGYEYNLSDQERVNYRTKDNDLKSVTVGTFGIGLERLVYSACDSCRDRLGFDFPEVMRPYDKAIVLINPKNEMQFRMGEKIYVKSRSNGESIYFEDRASLTLKEKLDYADFLGVKEKILIGAEEVKQSKPTIKTRRK